MEKDYQNFVDRMGSFEDVIDLTNDPKDIVKHLMTKHSDTELAHVGVLGMKWGHHKAVNATTIGASARTGKELTSLGQTVNKTGYSKKSLNEAKSMSDEDLKKLTNRMNLENNYMNAKNVQSGKGKVDNILATAGGALAVASSAAILYDTIKKFS